jgi:hypothetical protein
MPATSFTTTRKKDPNPQQSMTMDQDDLIRAIHDVVAGMRPLTDLFQPGLEITMSEQKDTRSLRREWTFGSCRDLRVVVTRNTIARGLSRLIELGEDIEAWASFVLAAPFIIISDAEEEDELIQVLWDTSFGEPLTASDLALVAHHASDTREGE